MKANSGIGAVDTLLGNACECEPYITADDALLCTYPEQVLGGMAVLMDVLKPGRTVLAVEDNKTEAISVLRSKLAQYPGIELKVLPTRYPQGAEKQLIRRSPAASAFPASCPGMWAAQCSTPPPTPRCTRRCTRGSR